MDSTKETINELEDRFPPKIIQNEELKKKHIENMNKLKLENRFNIYLIGISREERKDVRRNI